MLSRHLVPFAKKDLPPDLRRASSTATILANTVFHYWPLRISRAVAEEPRDQLAGTLIHLFGTFDTFVYPGAAAAYTAVAPELVAVNDGYAGPVRATCAYEAVLKMADCARRRVDVMVRHAGEIPVTRPAKISKKSAHAGIRPRHNYWYTHVSSATARGTTSHGGFRARSTDRVKQDAH